MFTRSWYALLALRMRVSMSAIGSVIVMGLVPFLAVVPGGLRRLVFGELRDLYGSSGRTRRSEPQDPYRSLPARLGHARQLAAVRHLPETDAAQAERAEHRTGPAAALAAGVTADAELRLPVRLGDQGLLSHTVFDLSNSKAARRSAPLPVHQQKMDSVDLLLVPEGE